MAVFRKVHVSFWRDPFVRKLTPEKKYFYLYLMTNPATKQCGIYELDISTISHETGYNVETVQKLIEFFENEGKIRFSSKTDEIALKNWPKYNDSTSPKVRACIQNELKSVKDRVLIQYVYSIDTLSQKEKEEEQEKEEEGERESETSAPEIKSVYGSMPGPKVPKRENVQMKFTQSGGTLEMANAFFDKYDALGWYKNGAAIVNWAALVPSFIQNWREIEAKKPKKTTENDWEQWKKQNNIA